jgi:hypothetical protein
MWRMRSASRAKSRVVHCCTKFMGNGSYSGFINVSSFPLLFLLYRIVQIMTMQRMVDGIIHERQNPEGMSKIKCIFCEIIGFRSGWTETFRRLGYYATWSGLKPPFRNYLSVVSSRVNLYMLDILNCHVPEEHNAWTLCVCVDVKQFIRDIQVVYAQVHLHRCRKSVSEKTRYSIAHVHTSQASIIIEVFKQYLLKPF